MQESVRGWAVTDADGNKVLIRTVGHSRVAAMVNWLLVARNIVASSLNSDELIEATFAKICGDARLVEVEVYKVQ